VALFLHGKKFNMQLIDDPNQTQIDRLWKNKTEFQQSLMTKERRKIIERVFHRKNHRLNPFFEKFLEEEYMKTKLGSFIVLMLMLSMLFSACTPAPAEPTEVMAEPTAVVEKATEVVAEPTAVVEEPAKPTAPEFIELGSSISLTGPFGSLGNMILPGYQIAVNDINADGGVYVEEYGVKIPLRLTHYDDESDPTKAVSRMENLYSEMAVTAFLGGGGSSMHAASAAIAEKNQVPYCGISFALYQIHQQGYKYLFSPFPKSPQQAKDTFEILNSIPEAERPKKVAIFSYSDDWGKELGGLWEENAVKNGYEVVLRAENPVAPNNDWSDSILKAKAAGAEVLLSMPIFPDGSGMFKTMAELGWAPKFSLVIRAPEGVNWGESMGTIGDYVTIFPGWHHGAKFNGVEELNAAYQTEFGRPADLLTGPAYACVQIVAAAIEKAGTLDRVAIRDAMAATNMDTVIGPVTFNDDGTGNIMNPLIQWQKGQMELVWPAEHATASFLYPAPPFDER
jgi:branched-chain amino acid transport system substrate-binding protein